MASSALHLSIFFALIFAAVLSPQDLPAAPAIATYDYVVVGCGIAGLVVSMRLSENEDVSVLCLEAGSFDHYEDHIQIPQFVGDDIGFIYDWNVRTTPQTQLDGATRPIPLGRAVGGGSIINGMVWNRGNQDDYNSWEALGNTGWSWDDLLPYFKKSETFTPIYYEGVSNQPVTFVGDAHGSTGPVSVSYPNYYWPQTDNWFRALNELGTPTIYDPDEGISAGGYFLASDIHPVNQTRSDARRTYYDPFFARKNYNILPNATVTRILFEDSNQDLPPYRYSDNSTQSNNGNISTAHQYARVRKARQPEKRQQGANAPLHATGVEYGADAASPRQTVLARREVILSAGAIHTPQLLQLSGLGPAALLKSLNIQVTQDLPGVGSNLQDHCLVYVNYPYQNQSLTSPYECDTNATFNDQAAAQYRASKTGPWTAMPSNALAFPSLRQILSHIPSTTGTDLSNLLATAQNGNGWAAYLPPTYDTSLRRGYNLQLSILLSRLPQDTTPAYEILNNNAGGLTVSLMHPLSRGTVQITSLDPFLQPAIDPRWATHPLDLTTLLAALQFNQAILDTSAMAELQPSYEPAGMPANPSPAFLTDWIKRGIQTEFHSSGTAAMLPRQFGGVVDSSLAVYGTSNVRVVDTSVFPLVPGAHLQAVAYAVAEKAADLIKAAG